MKLPQIGQNDLQLTLTFFSRKSFKAADKAILTSESTGQRWSSGDYQLSIPVTEHNLLLDDLTKLSFSILQAVEEYSSWHFVVNSWRKTSETALTLTLWAGHKYH